MYRGFLGNAAAALTLLALGGCVQFPRHSNTMVFGTVTNVGLTVGPGATSVPSISVGYKRE